MIRHTATLITRFIGTLYLVVDASGWKHQRHFTFTLPAYLSGTLYHVLCE